MEWAEIVAETERIEREHELAAHTARQAKVQASDPNAANFIPPDIGIRPKPTTKEPTGGQSRIAFPRENRQAPKTRRSAPPPGPLQRPQTRSVRMCGFLRIIMHPEGGLGFMDRSCDHRRTSDGDANHRIWQEFHAVLWDSTRFYEILRIMVSYGLLWLRLDFKAGFYEVPLGSPVGSAGFYDILLYSFVFFSVLRYALLFFCKADILSRILPIKGVFFRRSLSLSFSFLFRLFFKLYKRQLQ